MQWGVQNGRPRPVADLCVHVQGGLSNSRRDNLHAAVGFVCTLSRQGVERDGRTRSTARSPVPMLRPAVLNCSPL